MPYDIAWETRGVLRRYHGNLTLAERHASLQTIVNDARFDTLLYTITDYTAVDRFEDEPDATRFSAAMHIGPSLTNPGLMAAAVATRPDVLRSILTFKRHAPPTMRYEVFSTLALARQWIDSRGRGFEAAPLSDGSGR